MNIHLQQGHWPMLAKLLMVNSNICTSLINVQKGVGMYGFRIPTAWTNFSGAIASLFEV